MPRKDKKKYEQLKSEANKLIGTGIDSTLELIVKHTEEAAKKSYQAAFDGDKIAAIDGLLRCYLEGFESLVSAYKITGTNLTWFVNNYQEFFNTGIDMTMPYVSFRSEHLNNNGYARLEVASRDDKLDWKFELYKGALERGQTPDPKIQRHLTIIGYTHQRDYHKKLSCDVKI